MFSLAHVYFAERLLGSLDPPGALGAIYPDTGIASGLAWEETHCATEDLYRTALTLPRGILRRRALSFSRAALTHGARPPGLDHYADESYRGGERGYAFQLAAPYADVTAEICRLPPEMGLWKAHNFVEMAAEVVVDRWVPDLGATLASALTDPEVTRESAGFVVRAGHAVDVDEVAEAFTRMPRYLALEGPSPEALALRYERQVMTRHEVESIDVSRARELIDELVPLVERTLPDFFDHVEARVKRLLDGYPG